LPPPPEKSFKLLDIRTGMADEMESLTILLPGNDGEL